MGFVISSNTAFVFALYGCLILQHIFFGQDQKTLRSLLIVLCFVVIAWILEPLSHTSIPFIILLFLSAYCAIDRERNNIVFSRAAFFVLAILSLLFALHKIPGFHNELVFSSEHFGQSGLPFHLYANLDKALAALAILITFNQTIKWKISVSDAKFITLGLILFFGLCWLIGANTDPKFSKLTFAFIYFNLFVTCLAEEAFFRLIIQDKLAEYLPGKYSAYLAIFFTALIFMLAHFHTGIDAEKRLALIFLAGLLYGAVYLHSKSLGSAIYLHFSINLIHFSFFAYPATFSN